MGVAWGAVAAPSQLIEGGIEIVADGIEPVRIDAAIAKGGVQDPVGRVRHKDEMMIEIGLQPLSDVDLNPLGIEAQADLAVGGFGVGDGVNLAQHAFAVIVQRAREQLALGRDRDVVGALRRAQHGDNDADDRDGNDNANRNHDAAARVIAAGGRSSFARIRHSQGQLIAPLRFFGPGGYRRNNCDRLALPLFRGLTARWPGISDGGVNRRLKCGARCSK